MTRTRGRDSLHSTRQRGPKRRRIVHVFTEGEVTEPTYIEVVEALAKERGIRADPTMTVEVRIANASAPGSQRKPVKLVEAAVRLMREENRAAKRSKLRKDFWPQVWCLFDRDEHKDLDAALKEAREGGVRVAFSHPCFELWRILHHKTVSNSFGGVCNDVTTRLPFARNPRDAANIKVVLPEQLPEGSFAKAKKRAQAMNASYGPHVPLPHRDPYTDMYAFVEDGMGVVAY